MESTGVTHYSLTAVLFADIYSYSKLMSRNEAETSNRVSQAISLIRQLTADYGGSIKSIAGDGVVALFDNVSNCVNFAVAMQQEFVNDAVWNSDSDPISFRIGINVGEVREGHFGLHGHAINVAARLQTLAKPGGICVTKAVSQVARNTANIPLTSMGTPKLKNIEEPIEVFEIEPGKLPARSSVDAPSIVERAQPRQDIPDNSIAVMPLDNLSGELQNVHLCNGVTGDIISNLTRFNNLHVIAQQSSSLFENQQTPADEIGRKLGVRYLTTGGFQRAGDQLRVGVQLIEAASGRAVWAETFNGSIQDVFSFQDEITAVIASCLSVKIDKAESQRQQRTAPADLQAYGLILRGREVYKQPRRELNLHARRLFEQASTIDPDYAVPYASISRTSNDAWRFDWADHPEEALDDAISKAEMALHLDPDDARGHAALGNACLYKRRHDESLAAYERAIKLNPNDADILAEMGHSASVYGDPERAVDLIEQAMRLNPFYPDWYLWHLGEAHFDISDYEEAIRTLTQMHDKTEAYRMLTASNALLGRMDEAQRHAKQILETHPEFTLKHWENVPPDRNPEPRERLIEGLKKAGLR
ncbi:invasion protein regulator [Roseovarius albus]|uniref:Invasion protein regulator n=1 Tax=Roseovarius albus TaxID=1247867 RepID=A0A1X7A6B3_9RHOB|nr:tetratricopeptide repeat protein [Roseovarius albus]SLN71825.1 invasion protein regulator [Roseovarius albus]